MTDSMSAQSPTAVVDKDTPKYFPFLLLPAELRIKIYRYSLVEDPSEDSIKGLVQPPLIRTNKQIRSEALPIYYGENQFHLDIPAPSCKGYPDDWPNFIRMFRAFKAGRSGGRGTGSLRFIRDIQCRLCETIRFDCWQMRVTLRAFSMENRELGEIADVRDGERVAERGVIYFWRDLESIRRFLGCHMLDDQEFPGTDPSASIDGQEFPGTDTHEEYLHRLVTSVVMICSECVELTKSVEGFVWAAIDQQWDRIE